MSEAARARDAARAREAWVRAEARALGMGRARPLRTLLCFCLLRPSRIRTVSSSIFSCAPSGPPPFTHTGTSLLKRLVAFST